jgi:hypothetical protein
MNASDENLRFDRLVDGELSEEERRELLAGLDDEPGGWRRCALAFLQAQCWRQSLGTFVFGEGIEQKRPVAAAAPAALPQMRRSPWPSRLGTAAAMAASFLAALWLGSLSQQTQVAQSPDSGGNATPIASENKGIPPEIRPAADPWHMVNVSSLGRGSQPGFSMNVPAIERDNLDEQSLRSVPPAIPDNVAQALSRTGHKVQQRREFVPVSLEDGRQLIMPVDHVDIHYVGNRTY